MHSGRIPRKHLSRIQEKHLWKHLGRILRKHLWKFLSKRFQGSILDEFWKRPRKNLEASGKDAGEAFWEDAVKTSYKGSEKASRSHSERIVGWHDLKDSSVRTLKEFTCKDAGKAFSKDS